MSRIAPGSHVGPYEVLAPLGKGGMGEVWRARDLRLGRDVALKALPEGLQSDPARVGRFDREARLVAALHHPNVASLHGVEEQAGERYLVLECVEGATLAQKLEAGPLPLDEALDVCRQVATGIEAAHEHGVIHRDLKPANVMITPAGDAKVLDFGLAKPSVGESAPQLLSSPTLSHGATAAGVILGTAPYMSPEQARGKAVDRRTDVWSFGCVLFECLSGRLLFTGETVSDVIGRILQTEPDWTALPAATPPRVRELLRRCLARDPRKRLRDIGEARVVLEEVLAGTETTEAEGSGLAAAAHGRERLWMALCAVLLLTAVALATLLARAARPAAPPAATAVRATIALPPGLHLDGTGPPVLAISRDGRTLAFVARGESGPARLYLRRLDSAEVREVPDSESAEGPFFSPDGRFVAFAVGVSMAGGQRAELRKHSLETRLTQVVCPLPDYFGGAWRQDDTILFVGTVPGGLWTVDARGGKPRLLVERFRQAGHEGIKTVLWPELLPDERTVLLDDWDAPGGQRIIAVELATGEVKDLGLPGWGARHLVTGQVAYGTSEGALMAVPFDLLALRATGAPLALASDLAIARNASPAFAVSANGTLIRAVGYLRGSQREPMRIVAGAAGRGVKVLPVETALYSRNIALSPDGRVLAARDSDDAIWLIDLARGTRVRLPSAQVIDFLSMRWTRDGRSLVFSGTRSGERSCGIYRRSSDGTGAVEPVVTSIPAECQLAGWDADGRSLFYLVRGGGSVDFMRLDPGASPRVAFHENGGVAEARVSPDGRFLAFDSNAGGDYQVYVHSLADGGEREAVTRSGGRSPVWARDGRALYFHRDRGVWSVPIDTTRTHVAIGPEHSVLEWNAARGFEVGPDGTLYGVEPVPGAAIQTSFEVQTGWAADVGRLAVASDKR